MDRHFLKTHQLHELLNSNNVKVSYISYFKSAINSHNKNMLTEQEKYSPCNCRDKTSYQLNGCYQYKNLIYSCKVSTPDIKKYHPHYIGLTEHKFKDEKDNRFFKNVSKWNSRECSNFTCGKRKEKIKVGWSILKMVKLYLAASKKCILYLTEKYHIIFFNCWTNRMSW